MAARIVVHNRHFKKNFPDLHLNSKHQNQNQKNTSKKIRIVQSHGVEHSI